MVKAQTINIHLYIDLYLVLEDCILSAKAMQEFCLQMLFYL